MMQLYEEKDFAKRMDSTPQFLVAFVAIMAVVTLGVGWGLTRCIDLFCNAVGFAEAVLPTIGVLILSVLLLAAQGYVAISVKGVMEHVRGTADNFRKSYAALYAFSASFVLFLSWNPMLILWECAKDCWSNGGFCYALACLDFTLAFLGLLIAIVGTFGIPFLALAVLFGLEEKMKKDDTSEVNHG